MRSPSTEAEAAFSQSGWLVTKIKEGPWKAAAVGDGEHAWAWKPNEKGIWLVDSSGDFANETPLLPNVAPGARVASVASGQRALVILEADYEGGK